MWRDEFHKEKFKLEHDQPDDFTRCFWQKQAYVLPVWIAYRLFQILYFTIIIIWYVLFNPEGNPTYLWYKNFIYISTWGAYLQWFVFVLAFAVTVDKFMKERKDPNLPPMKKMPWHYKLLWSTYSIAAAVTLVISFMYWLFVFNPEKNTDILFAIICKLFNSLFMIIDLFVYAIPYRFLHVCIPPVFPAVYVTFSLIYQLSGGTGAHGRASIYEILDWRKPGRAFLFVIMFFACTALCHCGMFTLHVVKHWLKRVLEEPK